MCSLLLLSEREGRHLDDPAPDAVIRRSDLHGWHPRRERRWITNSAGANLLENASAAGLTLPTKWAKGRLDVGRASRHGSQELPRDPPGPLRRSSLPSSHS